MRRTLVQAIPQRHFFMEGMVACDVDGNLFGIFHAFIKISGIMSTPSLKDFVPPNEEKRNNSNI